MLWKLFFGKIILNFCLVLCNRVTTEECVSEGKNKGKPFSRNHAFFWQCLIKLYKTCSSQNPSGRVLHCLWGTVLPHPGTVFRYIMDIELVTKLFCFINWQLPLQNMGEDTHRTLLVCCLFSHSLGSLGSLSQVYPCLFVFWVFGVCLF